MVRKTPETLSSSYLSSASAISDEVKIWETQRQKNSLSIMSIGRSVDVKVDMNCCEEPMKQSVAIFKSQPMLQRALSGSILLLKQGSDLMSHVKDRWMSLV